jgi:hypothetical protein
LQNKRIATDSAPVCPAPSLFSHESHTKRRTFSRILWILDSRSFGMLANGESNALGGVDFALG